MKLTPLFIYLALSIGLVVALAALVAADLGSAGRWWAGLAGFVIGVASVVMGLRWMDSMGKEQQERFGSALTRHVGIFTMTQVLLAGGAVVLALVNGPPDGRMWSALFGFLGPWNFVVAALNQEAHEERAEAKNRRGRRAAQQSGGKGHGRALTMTIPGWELSVDFYTKTEEVVTRDIAMDALITHTDIRAHYRRKDFFTFRVERLGIGGRLGRALRLNDGGIRTGDAKFDHRVSVESNDAAKARGLFADRRLRELILSQPRVNFEAMPKVGEGGPISELRFAEEGVIDDPRRLEILRELFGRTLDRLVEAGIAEKP